MSLSPLVSAVANTLYTHRYAPGISWEACKLLGVEVEKYYGKETLAEQVAKIMAEPTGAHRTHTTQARRIVQLVLAVHQEPAKEEER